MFDAEIERYFLGRWCKQIFFNLHKQCKSGRTGGKVQIYLKSDSMVDKIGDNVGTDNIIITN